MKTLLIAVASILLTSCGDYAPWPEIGSKLPVSRDKALIESTVSHDKFRIYQSNTALYVTCDKDGTVVAVWSSASNVP